jgi:hypothetical protein
VFSAGARRLTWSAALANRPGEVFDFYNCPLHVPSGMYVGSFPNLPGKINRAAVFNRRTRTIVIAASKDYGPTSTALSNLGVSLAAHGRVSWKLTLKRVR